MANLSTDNLEPGTPGPIDEDAPGQPADELAGHIPSPSVTAAMASDPGTPPRFSQPTVVT
jgi:hypothetical protein